MQQCPVVFNAFIYLNDDRLFPLQIVLREILIANDIDLELTGDVIDDEARQGLRELNTLFYAVGHYSSYRSSWWPACPC